MSELLNNISNSNLVTITILMSVVALVLAVAISIEIYRNTVKTDKLRVIKDINIQEVEGINYVDEDSELEKTKARMELEELKERLRKEEIEKNKLLEMNMALAINRTKEVVAPIKEEKTINEVMKETQIREEKTINERIEKTQIKDEISINKIEETPIIEPIIEEKVREISQTEEDPFLRMEIDDEESAIISYEELKNNTISVDGSVKYEDEKTAVISILELEKLYEESQNITTGYKEVEMMSFDVKKVEDLPQIKDYTNFQSSPYISPIHGLTQTENDIILTSTANLERLNREIRKTNEFLQALKVLKKNLE